jgi:hypothetical protein
MSCGCKNKNNGQPQQTQQPAQNGTQTNQPKPQTVQESIKKVVEKYYGKGR